jgi:hypothetical protein
VIYSVTTWITAIWTPTSMNTCTLITCTSFMNWVQTKGLVAIYPNSLKGELGTSEIVYYIASKVLTVTIFILRHKTCIVTSFRGPIFIPHSFQLYLCFWFKFLSVIVIKMKIIHEACYVFNSWFTPWIWNEMRIK